MEKQKYHFIGICGASMSALAIYLKKQGFYVQGSDIVDNEMSKTLKKYNIPVFIGHNKNNVKNCDVVVYSSAIKNNTELDYAYKNNLCVITRSVLLELISKKYKNVIAVSGAHGKTTTSVMIYNCLKLNNMQPTLHFGGVLKNGDCGIIVGKNDYFITEACEYQNNFLHLTPTYAIILNVEKEHLDFFKTLGNIKKSFVKFIEKSKIAIVNNTKSNKNVYGFNHKSGFYAKNIKENNGKYSFDCYKNGEKYYHFDLGAYGKHNVNNALSVITLCDLLKIDKNVIYKGLKEEVNIKRRFEMSNNKTIIHDYAHHPTEIKNSMETIKKILKDKKMIVVFQPHTYSRTKSLMQDFVEILKEYNDIYILKTFSAREKYDKNGSGFLLYKNIKKQNKNVRYFAKTDLLESLLKDKIANNYSICLLGAGSINLLAENLTKYVDNMVSL